MRTIGLAYLRFAVKHPEQYRLMFGAKLVEEGSHPEFVAASTTAFAVLQDALREAVDRGAVKPVAVEILALSAWSLVHGLASLALDGLLGAGGAKGVQAMAEQALALFLQGLAPQEEGQNPAS